MIEKIRPARTYGVTGVFIISRFDLDVPGGVRPARY
jgi:hypothetical protein